MKNNIILIVDDDPAIRFAFKKTFENLNIIVETASNGTEGVEFIKENHTDVVFMDISMPEMDGLEALQYINDINNMLPVVIITGYGNMDTAIQAMRLGAYDYITKPLDIEKIRIVANRAIEAAELKKKVNELEKKLENRVKSYKTNIIGQSSQMNEVFKKLGVISTTPNTTNILILGETGTGKELAAKVIHENGSNSEQPFLAINCTVFPENLLESELFGHEKGSFTGAIERKLGKFEIAKSGTIFLDEIGDMPMSLQGKLLRVIQERSFERLGGNINILLNARIIAATHRDLKKAIQKGEFRKDLYFRLNVIEIDLPPLRDRREDISSLAQYFVEKFNKSFGKNIVGITDEILIELEKYDFPGNVRQLENIIERACALVRSSMLSREDFPPSLFVDIKNISIDVPIISENFNEAKKKVIESFEKTFIIRKLEESNGNVTEAARLCSIERQSFQRIMKKHNIKSMEFKK